MAVERQICGICAWRRDCQKRFKLSSEAFLGSHCPDYTRDLTIKSISPEALEDEKSVMDKMVEQQLDKWRRLLDKALRQGIDIEQFKGGPVITVSRDPGSGGSEIARRVANGLDMDLIGGQIIQHVADSARMSRKVIESLDEKEVKFRETLLSSLFGEFRPWPGEYLQHLTRVIGTIAVFGNVVIVGRGANHILPPQKAFKVRIIAPLEFRINYFIEDRGYTRSEAEQYVIRKEADRKAFVRKFFNADVNDPKLYDIIINTGLMTLDAATETIITAFKKRLKNEA
ncbi:MAG TPA: cytidylate kinase-like family protein [Deltaproteobacteria bacterium]|nr:cytidylate kinase-like family protein [Deltaproteobacteria bacterium]